MIQLGDSAELARTWTASDLREFAALTGWNADDNVPDPLIAAMLSCLLGTRLPGPGTGWLKLDLTHHAVARAEETLTARVTVTRLRPAQRLADLECAVIGDGARPIATGRALMLLRG